MKKYKVRIWTGFNLSVCFKDGLPSYILQEMVKLCKVLKFKMLRNEFFAKIPIVIRNYNVVREIDKTVKNSGFLLPEPKTWAFTLPSHSHHIHITSLPNDVEIHSRIGFSCVSQILSQSIHASKFRSTLHRLPEVQKSI
jgi:hypothetical protein